MSKSEERKEAQGWPEEWEQWQGGEVPIGEVLAANKMRRNCTQAALRILEGLRLPPGEYIEVSMEGVINHVNNLNAKIEAAIKTVKGAIHEGG